MCIGSHAPSRRRHVTVRFLDQSSSLVISMEFPSLHRSGIRNLEVASTFLWTLIIYVISVTYMIVVLGVVWRGVVYVFRRLMSLLMADIDINICIHVYITYSIYYNSHIPI